MEINITLPDAAAQELLALQKHWGSTSINNAIVRAIQDAFDEIGFD